MEYSANGIILFYWRIWKSTWKNEAMAPGEIFNNVNWPKLINKFNSNQDPIRNYLENFLFATRIMLLTQRMKYNFKGHFLKDSISILLPLTSSLRKCKVAFTFLVLLFWLLLVTSASFLILVPEFHNHFQSQSRPQQSDVPVDPSRSCHSPLSSDSHLLGGFWSSNCFYIPNRSHIFFLLFKV